MMTRVRKLATSREEKAAAAIGKILSDFSLDLDGVGKYLALSNPYTIYARAIEVLEAAKFNQEVAEYNNQMKYYPNTLF